MTTRPAMLWVVKSLFANFYDQPVRLRSATTVGTQLTTYKQLLEVIACHIDENGIMKKHKVNTLNSVVDMLNTPHYYAYHIGLMPSEFYKITVGSSNYMVVGIMTTATRSAQRGSSLGNKPSGLMCYRLLKSGKMGAQLFEHMFDPYGSSLADDLHAKYESLSVYALYDQHQLTIAKANVDEYCGYGWGMPPDIVCSWMNDNKYFWDLRSRSKANLEDRINAAKLRRMEITAEWYADTNMSGVFDSFNIGSQIQENDHDVLNRLRKLDQQMSATIKEITSACRFEDMRCEREDYQKMQNEFNRLVSANHSTLPKNSLGGVSIYGRT